NAEGEKQAAETLVSAAVAMSRDPRALQLRYLQTLLDIASEKSTIIAFPLPLDLIAPLLQRGAPGAVPPAAGQSSS
ncbi:MAG TPA: hypothetical protein VGI35_04745, partial [Steroidobacteraceae bacterium]